MQLADPRPAVPPGHVCRYNLRPPWTIGSSGTLEVLVYHHLMLDDDELVRSQITCNHARTADNAE